MAEIVFHQQSQNYEALLKRCKFRHQAMFDGKLDRFLSTKGSLNYQSGINLETTSNIIKNMKLLTSLIFSVFFIFLTSCIKEPEALRGGNKIEISGTTVDSIKVNSAVATSYANNGGYGVITDYGFCWGLYSSPDLTGLHTSLGALQNKVSFSSKLSGLLPLTKYYTRSYAQNNYTILYGIQSEFTTLEITYPQVTTLDVNNISATSAQCGGKVISDGNGTVSARGVCWNTAGSPSLRNCINRTLDGTGIGNFFSQVTGLIKGTTYYLSSYATNEKDTGYGDAKVFTTLTLDSPSVNTSAISSFTANTAQCGGNVTADGGSPVNARGVCWSVSSNPTTSNDHTVDGAGTGIFVSNLTGLSQNTRFYVRAYATNNTGTAYGNEINFTTQINTTLPTVTTNPATNITQTTATSGGNVTSDGGSAVTARGVCWSTSSNPTIAGNHTSDGNGTGIFVSNLTGLSQNTRYYVRAYATNNTGTAYGNEINFTTQINTTLPTVTTNPATNITQTTATSGGNVTSDGGSAVTARGVCWSTSSNPTISGNHTNDGSGTGIFVSNLSGLSQNTLYYIRAYAINSTGTAYGNEISFTTNANPSNPCPGIPTITYEGKVYNTVQIGTQCWLKENLNVGIKINANQQQINNGIKEKYCYNNLESNCDIYGGLYQWNEAMQYSVNAGAQGLCPAGWHLASDAEWATLTTYLGGETIAGGKMKETGTNHWSSPNTGATNESGFTGLPGGFVTSNLFAYLNSEASFWTSSLSSSWGSILRSLYYNGTNIGSGSFYEYDGRSLRCVKN